MPAPHNRTFAVNLDHKQFSTTLANLARAQPAIARGAFEEIASEQTRVIARRLPPKFRSLANSVTPSITGPARAPILAIGSRRVEARIRHYGGIIKTFEARGLRPNDDQARRRVRGYWPLKYLTIPMTRLGVPKYARARDYDNLFVFKSRKSGNLFLCQKAIAARGGGAHTKPGFKKRNQHGNIARTKLSERNQHFERGQKGDLKRGFRFMFLLRKESRIHAHPYLYWSDSDKNLASKIILSHLKRAATQK